MSCGVDRDGAVVYARLFCREAHTLSFYEGFQDMFSLPSPLPVIIAGKECRHPCKCVRLVMRQAPSIASVLPSWSEDACNTELFALCERPRTARARGHARKMANVLVHAFVLLHLAESDRAWTGYELPAANSLGVWRGHG
eukprot:7935591-Alexandrium_andersonii.AAC.1